VICVVLRACVCVCSELPVCALARSPRTVSEDHFRMSWMMIYVSNMNLN
jgi:hypothetical protein